MKTTGFIIYGGVKCFYERRPGKDGEICLATEDPEKYCNGLYTYSTKDPGDGMAFVVVPFIKPEDKQVIDIAILFNEGVIDTHKLADMVAMADFIIDRLYENGDVTVKSSKED